MRPTFAMLLSTLLAGACTLVASSIMLAAAALPFA